jgi:chromosome segregation ATPase
MSYKAKDCQEELFDALGKIEELKAEVESLTSAFNGMQELWKTEHTERIRLEEKLKERDELKAQVNNQKEYLSLDETIIHKLNDHIEDLESAIFEICHVFIVVGSVSEKTLATVRQVMLMREEPIIEED